MDDILFDLYYSAVHRNEELEQTVEEMQDDLNQAHNEIRLLNEQNDRLQRNIDIVCKVNLMLKHALIEVKKQ